MDDFIYSDKRKIILKHHAVINLASNANIKVGPPILLSSHNAGCFVFYREAVLSDGTKYYAIGEANDVKDNLWSEYLQQYEEFQTELKQIGEWIEADEISFAEYNDDIVRYLVERIYITEDVKLVINMKGGDTVVEEIYPIE